jgi:uncharacterized peroxidase-related enzyme
MPFLHKLGASGKVFDAFQAWPQLYGPIAQLSQVALRDFPSSLTAGERELVGAFVSRLNQCEYCYRVHNSAVNAFGIPHELVEQLRADIATAPVDEKLKPLLRYVRKLTVEQSRMTRSDADAVLAAGWTEEDLNLAVCICALFNFMNRLVHGLGIEEDPEYSLAAGPRLKALGYTGSGKLSKEERDRFVQGPR